MDLSVVGRGSLMLLRELNERGTSFRHRVGVKGRLWTITNWTLSGQVLTSFCSCTSPWSSRSVPNRSATSTSMRRMATVCNRFSF